MVRTNTICVAILYVLILPLGVRAVGPYVLTDLGDLPGALGFGTAATGINSRGQVVGTSLFSFDSTTIRYHAFLWTPTTANGTSGVMKDLGEVSDGSLDYYGLGINSLGQVVGEKKGATGPRAFLWTPTTPNGNIGTMTDLGDLPGASEGTSLTTAYDVNSRGQVVGDGYAGSSFEGFLWTPESPNGILGSIATIGNLESSVYGSTHATAINDHGQTVGVSRATNGMFHSYLWTPSTPNGQSGSMIDLGDLPGGSDESSATKINAYGQVVGLGLVANSPRRYHAFLWTPTTPNGTVGSMIDLGDLPGGTNYSVAHDVNSYGQVVGEGNIDTYDTDRAFLWTPTATNGTSGEMIDLNSVLDPATAAKWVLKTGNGINDAGQIVGAGLFDRDGPGGASAVTHAFLLTPVTVPEPGPILLFATWILFLAVDVRIRA